MAWFMLRQESTSTFIVPAAQAAAIATGKVYDMAQFLPAPHGQDVNQGDQLSIRGLHRHT
jgi:hypothetical protein